MGNSDLGLVAPLSARLQQRARCRVLPKLCLRPFPSHPRSSRRFEKTTKPNQLLISHRGRALGCWVCGVQDSGHGPGNSQRGPCRPVKLPCTAHSLPWRLSARRAVSPPRTNLSFLLCNVIFYSGHGGSTRTQQGLQKVKAQHQIRYYILFQIT